MEEELEVVHLQLTELQGELSAMDVANHMEAKVHKLLRVTYWLRKTGMEAQS